jgi:hypothetical protein
MRDICTAHLTPWMIRYGRVKVELHSLLTSDLEYQWSASHSIGLEAGWAPETVWNVWENEISTLVGS